VLVLGNIQKHKLVSDIQYKRHTNWCSI